MAQGAGEDRDDDPDHMGHGLRMPGKVHGREDVFGQAHRWSMQPRADTSRAGESRNGVLVYGAAAAAARVRGGGTRAFAACS